MHNRKGCGKIERRSLDENGRDFFTQTFKNQKIIRMINSMITSKLRNTFEAIPKLEM